MTALGFGAANGADLSGFDPQAAAAGAPGRAAVEAFAGPDLQGKNGRMSRIGLELAQLYFEHRDHLARMPGRKFVPANPLARGHDETVVIDAVATDDPYVLRDELVALGMTHPAVYGRYVSGLMPVRALAGIAALPGLRLARPAAAQRRAGLATSQGDPALGADQARTMFAVAGEGNVVGSMSDSYNCRGGAANDVASGDLPPGVVVLAEEPGCSSGTDEGRAMMQIVHDVAPGAGQAFHTAFGGIADFASGIVELASVAGAQVINDDVIYFAEPMFQDGVIAQAVDDVAAAGVAYFSAAGNDARQSYEAAFSPAVVSGQTRHDFNPGTGVDTLQKVTIPARTQVIFVLQWDQPFYSVSGNPGAASDLDITLYSSTGFALAGGVDDNIGGDPVEVFAYTNSSSQARSYQIGIRLYAGPAPGKVKYVYFGSMTPNEYATNSGSLYGHANAAGAVAVGAARYSQTPAFGVSPPAREYFSSAGGTPILRDQSGNPTLQLRQKPEVVAPDGGDNTFFGSDYEGNGWPNFFGTSAAAPHAAGIAALMRSVDPDLDDAQLRSALQDTATDMDAPGLDFDSGAGLIRAVQALASIVPPLAVATAALPAGRENEFYMQTLAVTGGVAPYTWAMAAGSLPTGLTLSSGGVLSGTPDSMAGSPFTFTVQVTDAVANVSTRVLSLTIEPCDCNTTGGCH